jgi:hypothetical protein
MPELHATALIQFPAEDTTTLEKLIAHLKASSTLYVIGTHVQDPTTLQITAEWPSTSSNLPSWQQNISRLVPSVTLVLLNHSSFLRAPPPFVEYVKLDFPESSTNLRFEEGIENDFARFEEIVRRRGKMEDFGEVFLTTGWTRGFRDEKGNCFNSFVMMRGWETMEKFREAAAAEAKEAAPILMGWGTPFELVCPT